MDNKFDDEVNDMRYYLHEHEYENCIIACEKLFAQLKENDKQFYYWACMHDEALCYRKLNNIDKSIFYANEAMFYDDIAEGDHIKTVWLMAVNYISKNKSRLAVFFLLQCSKYYKKVELKRLRIDILFNVAKAKNQPLTMIKLIKILMTDEDFTYDDMFQSEVGKHSLSLQECKEFIEFCLQNNYRQYIFLLFNSIINKEIKKEIKKITIELGCFLAF